MDTLTAEAPAKAARKRANGTLILGRDIRDMNKRAVDQPSLRTFRSAKRHLRHLRPILSPALQLGMVMDGGSHDFDDCRSAMICPFQNFMPHGLPPSILSLSEPSLGKNLQYTPVGTPTFCNQAYYESGFARLLRHSEKGIGF